MVRKEKIESYLSQLEAGRISIMLGLIIAGLGFRVSKRKFLKFVLPMTVLFCMAVWNYNGLISEGYSHLGSVSLTMLCFTALTLSIAKAWWFPEGYEFLLMVEVSFGPKTRNEIFASYLSNKMDREGMDIVGTAKAVGEYEGSPYAMREGHQ
ncbi:MAG: hypothetical protein B7X51_05850 [Pseudomonas sp. 34-62-33]|nr:MAG: hypothetical protein B7X51_05850 [Pseudomonas sp. 34-62-33]